MIAIPVIDLLGNHAVHAIGGDRAAYRPVESHLSCHGEVLPLVRRLHLDLGFETLYLADIDAIEGRPCHDRLITRIVDTFPRLHLWRDGGFRRPADISRRHPRVRAVIGSETWCETGPLPDIDPVLSLDRDVTGPRDRSGITSDIRRWPSDLILMTLDRVGTQRGPDLALLKQWRQKCPEANLYLAGGARDRGDLETAAKSGAAGILVASALHSGALGPEDLVGFI